MQHSGRAAAVWRRRRLFVAVLTRAGWKRDAAAAGVRELAAVALESAAGELRRGRDGRVRALVDRALRRLGLLADLES